MFSPVLDVLPLILSLFLLQLHGSIKAQENFRYVNCYTNYYDSGNAYAQSLDLTLNYMLGNASVKGFYNATVGENPYVVYSLLQCRAGISNKDCESCVSTAVTDIRQLCLNKKEASIGYVNCSLQYSYWKFFSIANSLPTIVIRNMANASDKVRFGQENEDLLIDLASKAASISSKLAVGMGTYGVSRNVHGMVECTKDLTESSCLSCLRSLISHIPVCCEGSIGGRLYSMSCNLRYENYTFSLIPSAPSPPDIESPITPPSQERNSGKDNTSDSVTVSVVIPVSVAFVIISILFAFLLRRNSKTGEGDGREMHSLMMDLPTLRLATRNFSNANKLGQGGFGPVFKGELSDGRKIAVKRLSNTSGQGLSELKTEVMLVAKLFHRNLVRLIGFCLDEEEKLLVYEYLPNGSLDKIIFDHSKRSLLDWERRYKIIVGIARGLLYLHEDSQLRIVHRDLKASNILLDENMNPKISDFGLAKLFGSSQTQGNTNRIAGTYGYMAPEYVQNGNFSAKSDVYSFGILVLEILSGRRNYKLHETMNLQSYVWQNWSNKTCLEVVDPAMGDRWSRDEVLKCIHVGLLCVQESTSNRPNMSEILMMLGSQTMPCYAPLRPAFFTPRGSSMVPDTLSRSTSVHSDQCINAQMEEQSMNEVTITDLDPR